jgi:hypothetical protein
MINKALINIDMDMTKRPIYDIEADVWEAIADEHGLDVNEIADGDLLEWL